LPHQIFDRDDGSFMDTCAFPPLGYEFEECKSSSSTCTENLKPCAAKQGCGQPKDDRDTPDDVIEWNHHSSNNNNDDTSFRGSLRSGRGCNVLIGDPCENNFRVDKSSALDILRDLNQNKKYANDMSSLFTSLSMNNLNECKETPKQISTSVASLHPPAPPLRSTGTLAGPLRFGLCKPSFVPSGWNNLINNNNNNTDNRMNCGMYQIRTGVSKPNIHHDGKIFYSTALPTDEEALSDDFIIEMDCENVSRKTSSMKNQEEMSLNDNNVPTESYK
jgi:hypothetical protein